MKKVSYFLSALAIMAFVACEGGETTDDANGAANTENNATEGEANSTEGEATSTEG